jgi:uncharacterized protein
MSEDIRIPCQGGELAAWLYRPTGAPGPVPCIVLTHGLSATRQDGLARFAERFTETGCSALAIDFRHLGDSSGEPRGLVDVRRQYEDIDAAIVYAGNLDGIDPARLAV